jgi:hypothetical protein
MQNWGQNAASNVTDRTGVKQTFELKEPAAGDEGPRAAPTLHRLTSRSVINQTRQIGKQQMANGDAEWDFDTTYQPEIDHSKVDLDWFLEPFGSHHAASSQPASDTPLARFLEDENDRFVSRLMQPERLCEECRRKGFVTCDHHARRKLG